jgi:hypothetical protein
MDNKKDTIKEKNAILHSFTCKTTLQYQLCITGKDMKVKNPLTGSALTEAIEAGRSDLAASLTMNNDYCIMVAL